MQSETHSELHLVLSLKKWPVLRSTPPVDMPARANPAFHQKLDSLPHSELRSVLNLTTRSGQRLGA
jgi:hypothetical protein